jgi:long-chain fatty acid transport protein
MKPPIISRCLALIAFPCLASVSYGYGFRIADQNAEATARGDAFAATADNPSAIYYNPAGITELDGTRALMGGYAITLKADVELSAPGGNSKFSTINTDLQTVPTFFATWKPKDYPIALGLGVYAPFGFAIEYDDDTPIRSRAIKASILHLTINPVFAWKVTDTLSVAVGPTISYGKTELKQGIANLTDTFKFKGDGVAYGFTAGVMWNPHKMHHFGLTYRSASKIEYSGHTTVQVDPFDVATPFGPVRVPGTKTRQDADAEIQLPQNIVFGYSFRPADDWNIEFNLDWTDWESLDTVYIHQQRTGAAPVPFNWRSSFLYEVGVTKKFSNGFLASAGYVFSEKSVPNESFSPAIPDSDRHIFSAGFGQRNEHLNWFLAYQYTYGPKRTIDQNTVADGDYRFNSHAVTLSLGYNF